MQVEQLEMKDAEVFLIKNFLSIVLKDELKGRSIYEWLDKDIPWANFPVKVFGKTFQSPRDNYYAADDAHPYLYSGFSRSPSEWTPSLTLVREKVQDFVHQHFTKPEHKTYQAPFTAVLCNRYPDGQSYIGEHSDDETDLLAGSFIASLSVGATRDFVFKHKKNKDRLVIKVENGDLMLMGKNCQKNWKHSVPKRAKVHTPRINLTYRSVRQASG